MTSGPDPVLLIHGAWQGAWVWDRLVPLLGASGLPAQAVDLPGNGADDTPPGAVTLALYVAHLRRLVAAAGRPVSLVAHSGGGLVASAVAEAMPDEVARLVYVAGMMLPEAMGFGDLTASLLPTHPEAAGVAPHLEWSADRLTSRVPAAAARTYFFHDCSEADAAEAARRLTPQPEGGRAVRPRVTAERFGRVPRLYVEAAADRAVIPACQRCMQDLVPGAAVATLATGHAPHLSAPDRLADVLVPFLLASPPR